MTVDRAASTLASWARAMRRALDAAEVDSTALFEQAALDADALCDPQARTRYAIHRACGHSRWLQRATVRLA